MQISSLVSILAITATAVAMPAAEVANVEGRGLRKCYAYTISTKQSNLLWALCHDANGNPGNSYIDMNKCMLNKSGNLKFTGGIGGNAMHSCSHCSVFSAMSANAILECKCHTGSSSKTKHAEIQLYSGMSNTNGALSCGSAVGTRTEDLSLF